MKIFILDLLGGEWEAGIYDGVYPAQTNDIASNYEYERKYEYICFGDKIYMEVPRISEPQYSTVYCMVEEDYLPNKSVYTENGFSMIDSNRELQEYLLEQAANRESTVSEPIAPRIGMTGEQVRDSSWGNPIKINKTTFEWGTTEQWCYSNYRYIYFEDGKVTAIQESID